MREANVGPNDPNFGDFAHGHRRHKAQANEGNQQSCHEFIHDLQNKAPLVDGAPATT